MPDLEKPTLLHMRRQPAEWPRLISFTETALAGTGSDGIREPAIIQSVAAEINRLSDKQLERNRYYALGMEVCATIKAIAEPGERAHIVQMAGAQLAESVLDKRESTAPLELPVFTADDLHGPIITDAFYNVVRQAHDTLSPAVRLLADITSITGQVRLYDKTHPDASPIVTPPNEPLSPLAVVTVQNAKPAAKSVQINLAVGTMIAMEVVTRTEWLAAHTDTSLGATPSSVNPSVTATEVAKMKTEPIAANLAALRFDEITGLIKTDGSYSYIITDEHGKAAFDAASVPKEPSADSKVVHTERLLCPALTVTHAVPYVGQLVKEIVTAGENLALERATLPRPYRFGWKHDRYMENQRMKARVEAAHQSRLNRGLL